MLHKGQSVPVDMILYRPNKITGTVFFTIFLRTNKLDFVV